MPNLGRRLLKKPFTIKILCIGTNHGPGADALQWAEKDAVDVALLLEGRVGCADAVTCLVAPTLDEVRAALTEIEAARPDVFVLYNSGHGSRFGFLVADDVFRYDELARWIRAIDAKHSLTILDVCHAGAYLRKHAALGEVVGATNLSYLELVAAATPSSRVICSVGVNRLSHEGAGVENGHLTASLLEAVSKCDGTLHGWITDAEMFASLEKISISRFKQRPLALGLTGDLPIVHAQGWLQGSALIIDTQTIPRGWKVSALVLNRYGIPTAIAGMLKDRHGRVLTSAARQFVPADDHDVASAEFQYSADALAEDPYITMTLAVRGVVLLFWHVVVCDLRGRPLEQCMLPIQLGTGSLMSATPW